MLPLHELGGRATGPTNLAFGILLPWVHPGNGQSVTVRVIHEQDQFLKAVPAVDFALDHSIDPTYGDMWSGRIDLTVLQPELPVTARWGQPGRYVYRLVVRDPRVGNVDWVIDPFAREFGVGRQSALTVPAQEFAWGASELNWLVPPLRDAVLYELHAAEFSHDLDGAIGRLDYLADLGVTAVSLMPVSNVARELDWGYLPIAYFGADERLGGTEAMKRFVRAAHERHLAVIVDAVYGHASRLQFAYQYVYDRLGYHENPFMGPFAKNLFVDEGASVDYHRRIAHDYFLAVNRYWLEEFHVDGFRYDCVPNYWDGATGVGYADLVYQTREYVIGEMTAGRLQRFSGGSAPRIMQIAEQLDEPVSVLWNSYSDATWQDITFHAAEAVAVGGDGAITAYGQALGLQGFPTQINLNGEQLPRTALQYIENHDHPRFIAKFGTVQTDALNSPLFEVGDRNRWYKLQPYLISLLLAKGVPLLYQGQELGESFTLPGQGIGRVGMLRPVNWDYFYDTAGRSLVNLTRTLLELRRQRPELRSDDHYFYNIPADLQDKGLLAFHRSLDGQRTLVVVNFTDVDVTTTLAFPQAGAWDERMHNATLTVTNTPATIKVPSNYGRIWTLD